MVLNNQGMMMGYLTAERCGLIGSIIAEGREVRAIFQAMQPTSAIIRVAFDGQDPVLPTAGGSVGSGERSEFADADNGFYPDYIPPDD